ncbi:MAG: hypothetical protein HY288_13290 [Planctomycetia bacterium]|nr:hypothetical protein [Planctomycetia bacterium]
MRLYSKAISLVWLATTLWVTLAVVVANSKPVFLVGASHGFYDHSTTATGWPIVFRSDQTSTPQPGAPNLPQFPVEKYNRFFSYPALSLDIAAAVILVMATATVCCTIDRLFRARKFSLQDLFWASLAFGVGVAIFMRWELALLDSGHLFRLLGADLDGPRMAVFGWYSQWMRAGLGIGTISGVLFTVRIFTWTLTGLRAARKLQ